MGADYLGRRNKHQPGCSQEALFSLKALMGDEEVDVGEIKWESGRV